MYNFLINQSPQRRFIYSQPINTPQVNLQPNNAPQINAQPINSPQINSRCYENSLLFIKQLNSNSNLN